MLQGCRTRRFRLKFATFEKNRAGVFHFVESASDITRLKLNTTAAIYYDIRAQSEMPRVERAVLDAVIQGEAHHVDVLDPALLQVMSETGVAAMGVIEERAVAVDVSLGPFVKNVGDAAGVE